MRERGNARVALVATAMATLWPHISHTVAAASVPPRRTERRELEMVRKALVLITSFIAITGMTLGASVGRADVINAIPVLPLYFEPDGGQGPATQFLARGPGYSVLLADSGATLVLERGKGPSPAARLHLSPVGWNPQSRLVGLEESPARVNHFLGSDPTRWRTNVPTYARVRQADVYPGVDLIYYGNGKQMEFDFVVAPGGDPSRIRLAFEGTDSLEVDQQGNLVLRTSGGELVMRSPVVYQYVHGVRREVAGSYVLFQKGRKEAGGRGAQAGFRIAAYDHTEPLIIDPVLAYSTFLGGNSLDEGASIAVDASGNTYVTGRTSSTNFPILNPVQSGLAGGRDVFVAKLNPAGSGLVYATYLGGSADDGGLGIDVDAAGNAYLTGSTASLNFPILNPFQSAFGGGPTDAFVAKLGPSGTIAYSSYLGGSAGEDGRGIVATTTQAAWVTGSTASPNFPTLSAFQPGLSGPTDAFVTMVRPDGLLLFSTYCGGSDADAGHGIALDPTDHVWVTGQTQSINFPTVDPLQSTLGGAADAFLLKLGPLGGPPLYATYLGGSLGDVGVSIAADAGGASVTGVTSSTNFPDTAPPIGPVGGGDLFVIRVAPSNALIYSLRMGGSASDSGLGIKVDGSGRAYVTGQTSSSDFPTLNPFQSALAGPSDAFVARLGFAASLEYSSYLGGSGTEIGRGIASDSAGNAYVVGTTTSTNFPVLNPFQSSFAGGPNDAFVTKVVATSTNQAPVANAGPDQAVDESDTVALDGSASYDPEGQPLSFAWTQIAGPSVSLDLSDPVHPTFGAPSVAPGGATLTFQLSVSDGLLSSAPDSVNVTVRNVNQDPVAEAGPDQTVNEGSLVALDGSGSFDPDGDALSYSWSQTAGPPVTLSDASQAKPTFTAPYVAAGGEMLRFELMLSDGLTSVTDTVDVNVENVNHAPTANAGPDQTVAEGASVVLSGAGSSDPDGDTLAYAWTQVDGPSVTLVGANGVGPTFTAPAVGAGGAALTFELVVNDGLVNSVADLVTVTVLDVNDPPACDLAQASLQLIWPPNHALVAIAITGVSDPDNEQMTVQVTGVTQDEPVSGLGSGDTAPDAVVQGSGVLLRAERQGSGNGRVYRVSFTAQDQSGQSCTGAVTVCVPPNAKTNGCVDSGQGFNSLQP
jgi:K319-like protein/beta-propeller repeat-containing protein